MTRATGIGRGRPGVRSPLWGKRKATWWSELQIDPQDEWIFDWFRLEHNQQPPSGYRQVRAVCRHTRIGTSLANLIIECPPGMVIDHINGDTLDNRRSNLRVCTQSENLLNRGADTNSASRFKGVCRSRSRWKAQICRDGKRQHIGVFQTEEDAARAYDAFAVELHGSFARLNFPINSTPAPTNAGDGRHRGVELPRASVATVSEPVHTRNNDAVHNSCQREGFACASVERSGGGS